MTRDRESDVRSECDVQVVASVVHTVAQNLGITVPAEARPSVLGSEEEVNWVMEVICHGLCLPLEDHMIIRDCVNIYCEWLSALLPNPKVCVPRPVLEDPNHYAKKIITHFNHLFVPRKGEGNRDIQFQFRFKYFNFIILRLT